MLWAKSDFPEQPPLYVKPLHLERAREPGVASRKHHAQPSNRPGGLEMWPQTRSFKNLAL